MVVKKEQLELNNEAARFRPIELLTENGFSIVRSWEASGAKAPMVGPYLFIVRDPDGYELEIVVEIERQVIQEVEIRSHGRIVAGNSYWISCAERHLSDYLWEHDDYPSG